MTDTHQTLAAALAAAQAEFPPIKKTKTVKVQTKTGGSYTFDYAPLDAIIDAVRPVLAKHGLAFSQLLTTTTEETRSGLRTILMHAGGGSIEDTTPLPATNTAQEQGSAITYLRRYALTSLLGIASEDDDDGNRAGGNTAADISRSRPERRVEGPSESAIPKTWAKVRESVEHSDNAAESWPIFEAYVRAASYHLFGQTDSKKLEPDQRKVMLQKAAGAAVWLHDTPHSGREGEFLYFREQEQRLAWAAVLDGTLLEIPDYTTPEPELDDEAKAEALQAEYEAAMRDVE